MIERTENRLNGLYISGEYADAIQAVRKRNNSPPTASNPLSAESTEETRAYLLNNP